MLRKEQPLTLEFVHSKTGGLTCCYNPGPTGFWLHSKYDPLREAQRWVEQQAQLAVESFSKVIVYGFGCGHHIRALMKHPRFAGLDVEVWETNLPFYREVLKQGNFSDIVDNPRVQVRATDDLKEIGELVRDWEQEHPFFVIYEPSMRMMPSELEPVKESLIRYKVFLNSVGAFQDLMQDNFQANTSGSWPGIRTFAQRFAGVPMILVAAGPSLARNMQGLIQAQKHCLIGSVGTSLQPLLNNGIRPDFFMIVDPKELVAEQIRFVERQDIPLFFFSTAYKGIPESYQGPRFLVCQEGYRAAEQRVAQEDEPLISSGGSVATALFDLLHTFGANPICTVGLDLAYTDNKTHVEGSHHFQTLSHVGQHQQVPNFWRNGFVTTPVNMKTYRDWFVNQAGRLQQPVYNATEGGAYLEGFEHLTLEQFVELVRHHDAQPDREKFHRLVQELYPSQKER